MSELTRRESRIVGMPPGPVLIAGISGGAERYREVMEMSGPRMPQAVAVCWVAIGLAAACAAQPEAQELNAQGAVAEEFMQAVQEGDSAAMQQLVAPLADGTAITQFELKRYLDKLRWGVQLPHYRAEQVTPDPEGAVVSLVPTWEPTELCVVKVGDRYLVDMERTVQISAGLSPEEFEALRGEVLEELGVSNLKQLCLAALMYAADHDEVLPSPAQWAEQLYPYMKTREVLRCASPEGELSFAYNAALEGVTLGDVTDPAGTVLFFTSELAADNASGGLGEVAPAREGTVYIGFVDGHVQKMDSANLTPDMFDPFREGE